MGPEGVNRLLVDEAIEIIYGASKAPGGATPQEKKAAREAFAAGPMAKAFAAYEARLARTEGPFLLGSQISVADLWCYFVVNMILNGTFDYIEASTVTPYPKTLASYRAVCQDPIVTAYKKAYADQYTWDPIK